MKFLERFALIVYSFIILLISVVLSLLIFNWIDFDVVMEMLKALVTGDLSSKITLGVSIVFILLSIKCMFFDEKSKERVKETQGILLKNENGQLMISKESIDNMAKSTSDKIIELNGGKPVNAVFVVGGGGKMPSYTKVLAKNLGIAPERVAIRGKEVLTTVDFNVEGFEKDSLYVTPVGICTNYYTQKNKFIFVNVNNERIKLYDNNKLTVFDAIMQIGYPNEKLFPRRGAQIEFMVNGKVRLVRGLAGEGAVITLNNKPASLNTAIEQNDVIFVEESTIGEPASITLGQIEEFGSDNICCQWKEYRLPKICIC